jgi:uncharacterized protein involved in exopolysaccharide biosynthesis
MDRLTIKAAAEDGSSQFWEAFLLPILKHKKIIYSIVLCSLLMTLVVCLLMKNKYTSTATILPSSSASLSSELKDLAAGSLGELGLGATPSLENVSALYPDILTSRLISERVLARHYSFNQKNKPKSMTLEDYIDAPNRDRAVRTLPRIVRIGCDKKTGVLTISVTTKYPEFSAAIVHAYLEELENYNINHRQSAASENEKFTSRRLKEIRAELAVAEDTLSSFQESNLNYMVSNDPELQMELARLQREIDIKASLYLTMAQQNELARIGAAKDVPVVQVLDRGSVPLEKSSPRRSLYLAAALMGSLTLAILAVLWIEISVKRGLDKNMKRILSSPSVRMNKLESGIARRLTRLADVFQSSESHGESDNAT